MKNIFIIISTVVLFSTSHAFGVGCTSSGKQRYSAGTMQICVGTTWVDITGASLGIGCTPVLAGKQRYVGDRLQFCDGMNWTSFTQCGAQVCTSPGKVLFTTDNRLVYCDNLQWQIINGACTDVLCSDYRDSASCSSMDNNCHWGGSPASSCYNVPQKCAAHGSMLACNADADCSWSFGTCISVY